MPLVKKTRGSGITKETVVSVRAGKSGFTAEDQAFVIRALQSQSRPFAEKLAAVEAQAGRILAKAGLPIKSGERFRYSAKTGKWAVVASVGASEPAIGLSRIIAPIAMAAGFEWDSVEGYAARIADSAYAVRRALELGQIDDALTECCLLSRWLTEMKLKATRADGPSRGGKKRWSPMDTENKLKACRQAFNSALKRGCSKTQAYETAARATGKSKRTIRYAVTGK
jgi:hypothetical protein